MTTPRVTFVDVAPVREHITRLVAGGASPYSISYVARLTQGTAWRTLHRPAKTMRIDNAEALQAVTLEQALHAFDRPTPYVDRVVLHRILGGDTETVVAAVDKPAYARALHARGWTRSRISRRLAMAWAGANKALTFEGEA